MILPATVFFVLTHCAPATATRPSEPTADQALPGDAELERMQAALSRRRVRAGTATTIEAELRALAIAQHKAARAAKRDPGALPHYATAQAAYALYAEHYPDSTHAHAMHYAYGELLYRLKDYVGAYKQYMKAVEVDPTGTHALFCAESAVYAAQEQLQLERKAGRAPVPPVESTAPAPPSPWDTHLQAALAQAIHLWPDGKRVLQHQYRSARNHYQLHQLDAAFAGFRQIIALAPQSREAQAAADLMIDTYATLKDYAALVAFVDGLLAQPLFGSPQYRAELATIRERAGALQAAGD